MGLHFLSVLLCSSYFIVFLTLLSLTLLNMMVHLLPLKFFFIEIKLLLYNIFFKVIRNHASWGPRKGILSYFREIWIRVTTSKINENRVFVALASVLQLYSSQTSVLFGKFDMEQHILISIGCVFCPHSRPSPALEYISSKC